MKPIIIGAGPIGSNTARLIKRLNPLLIEARKEVGKPVQCTGLVSTKLERITKYPNELILNSIRGARLFSKKQEVEINGSRVMARVIDRAGFDQWMNKDVKTLLNESFINYHQGVVKTSKKEYKTQLLIDCSGPKKNSESLLGVQAITRLKRNDNFVELHLDECNDFFGWVVPVGDGTCRVGLASNQQPMNQLKRFLKKIGAGRVSEWNAGLIPISVNEFIDDGLIRCGDAAGQVKAVSGGGLVTGLVSSRIMSQSVLKAYEKNDFSKEFFKKHYYKPWKKIIGRELRLHSRIRKVMNKTNNDELIRFLKKNKSLIESHGDMDYPSKFIMKLLKPSNAWFMIKSLFKFILA